MYYGSFCIIHLKTNIDLIYQESNVYVDEQKSLALMKHRSFKVTSS